MATPLEFYKMFLDPERDESEPIRPPTDKERLDWHRAKECGGILNCIYCQMTEPLIDSSRLILETTEGD